MTTPDIQTLTDRITDHNITLSPTENGCVLGRAQHFKHHGCASALFTVAPDLPDRFRHGVFATPNESFDALIRFSNGGSVDDRKKDTHGMAIKLLNVTDAKGEKTVQDFVLIDNETFFTGDLPRYEHINKVMAEGRTGWAGRNGLGLLAKAGTLAKIGWEHGIGMLRAILGVTDQRPASPLSTDYWSTTPYKLGDDVVKYQAVSLHPGDPKAPVPNDKDYLRHALTTQLAQRGVTFVLVAQVQDRANPDKHPIEDPTVSWSKNGAEIITLGTLTLPRQDITTQEIAADKLVFSPWNSLDVHAPLGQINLTRKQVYQGLSTHRHNGDTASRDAWAQGIPSKTPPSGCPFGRG